MACCLFLFPLLSGCGQTGYLLRQGWHQLKLLRARQPLEQVLRRRDLSDELREKLIISQLARRYAEEVIGLRQTAAYTTYLDTSGRPLAWNLSACPKDRLQAKTWRFPLVGEVPYLGFLERDEALRAQLQLEQQGYDTDLRPVNAWSSLGWFDDPLTSGMLEEDIARLSQTIFHELTHSTIFIRGQVGFNESLAVFVGGEATRGFLHRLFGPLSLEVQRYEESLHRQRRFVALVDELYARLKQLYSSQLSSADKLRQREEHFRWAQQHYREIFPDSRRWGRFGRGRLNNAVLLNHGRYHSGVVFHERVFERLGRDLPRLVAAYRAAQRYPNPIGRVAEQYGVAMALLRQRH